MLTVILPLSSSSLRWQLNKDYCMDLLDPVERYLRSRGTTSRNIYGEALAGGPTSIFKVLPMAREPLNSKGSCILTSRYQC